LGGLTITGAVLDGATAGVRCVEGTIAAVGPGVAAQAGDETIDAGGMPLIPALVNGHTHAAMTLFRGYGGDLPLICWLEEKIWPVEARLEAEDVYWGTRLACAEMIRTGTARFWDMYWQPEATGRAVEDAGLRAHIGGPLFDADGRTAEMQAQRSPTSRRWPDVGRRSRPRLPRTRSTRSAKGCCAGQAKPPSSGTSPSTSTSPRAAPSSTPPSSPGAC
jgi:cytosine/adenosine deaminase-related metal-dependent hydrolase